MRNASKIVIILAICAAVLMLLMYGRQHKFPRAIVVHESASQWGDVQYIRGWHQKRGWSDIGYHAVILNGRRSSNARYDFALDGKIEPGRSESLYGAHCEGDRMNYSALGVCLIGTPGRGGYPTQKQIDSLVHYCAIKCHQYDIPVSAITQHSDHEPRKPLDASLDMDEIRYRVQQELDHS